MKRIGFWKQGRQKSRRYVLAVVAIVALLFATSLSAKMSADQQHEAGQQNQTEAPPRAGKPSDSEQGLNVDDPESVSKQSAVQCGVLKLEQSSQEGIRQLPLYCISGKFYSEYIPSNLPHKELPVLQDTFLPESDITRWGAYFLNESSNYGYLMLAPRHWEVTQADTGMDGSVKIEMQDPANQGIHMTYLDVGACMGCAIGEIGRLFPEKKQWTEERGFAGDTPVFKSRTLLNEHMALYKLQKDSETYETYGAAYQDIEQDNASFTMLEIEVPKEQEQVAQTMIDFYTRYPTIFAY
ncbi:DUF4850 domain-containing protein [Paenibacillus sp. KQZ6P-2]|uniref:DUF4850 domain-containing protein n=1 Tax=Paenibacillus mangrovi TaxID=2931978 RepID=A0A9X2B2E4_9BACL|nr:DUF4850 domain-containing protein [Paenibacillus mangrovi]MCJ8011850.1 DUF4850 domain-containing protein [Paenibacillus mangrovi]